MKKKNHIIEHLNILALAIILIAGILSIPEPVFSQSRTPTPPSVSATPQAPLIWSKPVSLSNPMVKSWFPDVATSVGGSVHVVWASTSQSGSAQGASGFDVVMYTNSQNGITWASPNDIGAFAQSGGSEATRPALYIDSYDRLHLTYRGINIFYTNAPSTFAALAAYWSPRYLISSDQVAYFSDLTQDRYGMLHLLYTENAPTAECDICYHLYYRRSTDSGATWSDSYEFSQGITGVAKPQLLSSRENNLVAVFEKGIGGSYGQLNNPTSVAVVTSNDGGLTWNVPQEIAGEDENAKNITVGLDGKGQLITVWLNTVLDVLEYRVSVDQGNTWSEAKQIPGILGGWSIFNTTLDDYTMATDSAGVVHFVGVGRIPSAPTELSLLHLTWDGENWSAPATIATYTGDAPEWPRLAVGNGNQLHLVWFVREAAHLWESDQGLYRVWYAQATSSAPQIKATPIPEISSTPTATLEIILSTPTPKPSSTPDPFLQRIPPPPGSIYSEYDEVILVAISLAPALVVLVILIAVIRLRQR